MQTEERVNERQRHRIFQGVYVGEPITGLCRTLTVKYMSEDKDHISGTIDMLRFSWKIKHGGFKYPIFYLDSENNVIVAGEKDHRQFHKCAYDPLDINKEFCRCKSCSKSMSCKTRYRAQLFTFGVCMINQKIYEKYDDTGLPVEFAFTDSETNMQHNPMTTEELLTYETPDLYSITGSIKTPGWFKFCFKQKYYKISLDKDTWLPKVKPHVAYTRTAKEMQELYDSIIDNVIRPYCNNRECTKHHEACEKPCDKVKDIVVDILGGMPEPYQSDIDYRSLCKFEGSIMRIRGKNLKIFEDVPAQILAAYGLCVPFKEAI